MWKSENSIMWKIQDESGGPQNSTHSLGPESAEAALANQNQITNNAGGFILRSSV